MMCDTVIYCAKLIAGIGLHSELVEALAHDAPDPATAAVGSRKYVVSETSSQNLSRLARTKFSP